MEVRWTLVKPPEVASELPLSPEVTAIMAHAKALTAARGQTVTSFELVLLALVTHPDGAAIFRGAGADIDEFKADIEQALQNGRELEQRDRTVLDAVGTLVRGWGRTVITTADLAAAMLIPQRVAVIKRLAERGVERVDVLNFIAHGIRKRAVTTAAQRLANLPRAWLVRAKTLKRATSCSVHVHNDNYTTFTLVREILGRHFDKTLAEANEIIKVVQSDGRSLVGVYRARVATKKAYKATYAAHRAGYPLRFSVESDS
jgi:ATP-dependent Clp protease adapter protein ClpS